MKDKFHLKDWTVRFSIEDVVNGDPDAWGHCKVIYGRKIANVTLAEELVRQDEQTIKQVIAHELIHIHLNAILESTRELLGPLSADMHNSINRIMHLEIERATDTLSFVIADLFREKDLQNNDVIKVDKITIYD